MKLKSTDNQNKVLYVTLLMTLLCFFCNVRFSFVVSYLEASSTFRKNETYQLAFYWMIALFTGLTSGAYLLSKYFEEKGSYLFRIYLVIASGTILSCLLLYFFNVQGTCITNQTLLLIIRLFNAFCHPIAFITPALILMKIYKNMQSIRISSLFILAAISGMQMSYFATLYVTQNNLQLFCKLFLSISILIAMILALSARLLITSQKNLLIPSNFIETKPLTVILAIFVGCVFNTGMRYHYFFVDRYITDVLVMKHDPIFGYVFFYIALSLFLPLAAHFFKQENQQKSLTNALMGLLVLSIASIFLPIHSLINYAIYQIVFALFLAIFLALSLPLIFLMFKNNRLVFNGTLWFSMGYALGNLTSDWVTARYGFFTQSNYLPMLPFVLGGLGCLGILLYMTSTDSFANIQSNKEDIAKI